MRDISIDGRLQVTAAVSLLECSRLVRWNPESAEFAPVPREAFEFCWQKDVDPVFGRLICWINFSVGAEFLAKGVCLLHNVEIRQDDDAPVHPSGDLHTWVTRFRKDCNCDGTVKTTNFGTLGNLYDDRRSGGGAALKQLCVAVEATEDERELLLAAYELLARTIRNRDAHAYVPNVRDDQFPLVPDLFAKCFNVLLAWLPGGRRTLNKWRDEARQFIGSL